MLDSIIQTPPGAVQTEQPIDFLIDQVCSLIGRSKDTDLRTLALNSLDRAVDDLNGAGVFLYRQKEALFTSFTDGQTTLTKPSDWAWPMDPAFCYQSDGTVLNRIEWKSWDQFEGVVGPSSNTDRPFYASLRSPLDDDIYVTPAIEASAIASIKMSYIARLQRISEVTDGTLRLIPEVREALIRGGEAYVMRLRYAKYPNIWSPFWAQFKESIITAQMADRRWLGATNPSAVPELTGYLSFVPTSFKPSAIIVLKVGA